MGSSVSVYMPGMRGSYGVVVYLIESIEERGGGQGVPRSFLSEL